MTAGGAGATLAGAAVVVTGASRGIGAAVARALAGQGAEVALVARNRAPLEAAAATFAARAFAVPCDLRDADATAAAGEAIARRFARPVRILVHAAGAFHLAPLDRLAAADADAMIGVNLMAPLRLVRAFLPAMREAGAGHIVTIGSAADRSAWPGNGAYAASKYGVRAVHEVLRAETRGTGVRATLVSPAATDTALWDALDPDSRDDLPSRAEMLHADDVARAVLFALTQPDSVNVDELRLSHR